MSGLMRVCFRPGMRRCIASQVTGWRWQLIAGLAFASVVLFAEIPLFGQVTPEQKLTEAYSLERNGDAAMAIPQLQSLLDSKSLDPAGIGKAWNVLGLAFEDEGDFSASRHAFEQSIEAYEGVPNDARDYAMVLDDFGEFFVTTGQLDLAVRVMERALKLYEANQDHAGVARASSDLAGALLSQKNIREGRKSLDRALKASRLTNKLDDDDLATLASLEGWLAQCEGNLPTSVSKYQRSLDLMRTYHGEEHTSTGWAYVLLGQAHAEMGDLSKSITEMTKGLAILRRTLNSQDPRLLSAQIAYSRVLDKAGKGSEARLMRAKAQAQMRAFRNSQCVDCTVSAKAFH